MSTPSTHDPKNRDCRHNPFAGQPSPCTCPVPSLAPFLHKPGGPYGQRVGFTEGAPAGNLWIADEADGGRVPVILSTVDGHALEATISTEGVVAMADWAHDHYSVPPALVEPTPEEVAEMEAAEERYRKEELRRINDRPITTKRWHRLKATRPVVNGVPQADCWGFLIDEKQPEWDDRMQYTSPNFIRTHGNWRITEGMPAVGRYVSDVSSGYWEVWARVEGRLVCLTQGTRVETAVEALDRMVGER